MNTALLLVTCLALGWVPAHAQTQPQHRQAATVDSAHALTDSELQTHIASWLPTDALLLGEQHDAPEHQALQARVVKALASQGKLAALLLEMADSGNSTQALQPAASEEDVKRALAWQDEAWPWAAYGPVVMQAVREGVPVLGANLPRAEMSAHMTDSALDQRLPPLAWAAQQQAIREGHCGLLPERQIVPMTRIQLARDVRMAQVIAEARRTAKPGQVVMLVSGSAHADKTLGVPQHLLQRSSAIRVMAVRLMAGTAALAGEQFDSVLSTPPVHAQDYCAARRQQFGPKS